MPLATSKQTGHRRAVILTVAALCAPATACERGSSGLMVVVRDGHFEARDEQGRRLPASALLGAELSIPDAGGSPQRLRIDEVLDADGPVGLYAISRFDPQEQRWLPHCRRGPDGLTAALPIAGRWVDGGGRFVEDPARFTVTCTAGANGKCARMGYVPGLVVGETSLTPYFVACVRMLRADYCGDGRSHTEAGRPVEVVDRLGRQGRWYDQGKRFEAAWGPSGAICVARTRVPAHTTRAQLGEQCPRLREAEVQACDEAILADPATLLINRS